MTEMDNRENNIPPLFIGGFRSGSTLLINLLGMHPDIAPWFETKALCEPLRWLKVLNHAELESQEVALIRMPGSRGFSPQEVAERIRFDLRQTDARIRGSQPSGKASHEKYPIGYDCINYLLEEAEEMVELWLNRVEIDSSSHGVSTATGALIRGLGDRHAELTNATLWINKTPEIPRFGAELHQIFGHCKVVQLIRDGREVALSAHKLGWGSIEQLAHWWKGMIESSRLAAADFPEDYLEIRYEDLVANPESVMDGLISFIGVEGGGAEIVGEYRQRMGSNAFGRPLLQRLEHLGKAQRNSFEQIAGSMLLELNYE